MSESVTVGRDLAMAVLQVHGADGAGRTVLRKALPRVQVLEVFSRLRSCVVAMKSCGDAHFRSREMGKLGHDMRRIPLPVSSRS